MKGQSSFYLLKEVISLVRCHGLVLDSQAGRSVGYRQALEYLQSVWGFPSSEGAYSLQVLLGPITCSEYQPFSLFRYHVKISGNRFCYFFLLIKLKQGNPARPYTRHVKVAPTSTHTTHTQEVGSQSVSLVQGSSHLHTHTHRRLAHSQLVWVKVAPTSTHTHTGGWLTVS